MTSNGHLHRYSPARAPRSALTLVELAVVLTILVALAGLVVPNLVNFAERDVAPTAVNASLIEVRGAVMQYWNDCKYLIAEAETLDARFIGIRIDDLVNNPFGPGAEFDPETGLGWRGPYIVSSTLIPINTGLNQPDDLPDAFVLDANFNDYFRVDTESESLVPAIVDPWGTPIVIQDIDAFAGLGPTPLGATRRLRIVSAGSGRYEAGDNTIRKNSRVIDCEPQLLEPAMTADDHFVTLDLR